MKLIRPITILLLTCFVTFDIFSQSNAILNYLPEGAKMIIKINPASLGQKIKWEELLKYKMFQDLMKELPEEGKDFLNNPSQTGIDLGRGFFLVVSGNKNNKKPVTILYGIPKDTVQFAAMAKKLNSGKQAVKIGNGKLIIDNNTALAWNREIIILTGNDSKKDSANQTAKEKASAELIKTKQLTEKCKTLLNKRKTTFSNEQFLSLLKDDGDLLLWIDN